MSRAARSLIAGSTGDALTAMDVDDAELRRIAAAARERTLAEHTADHRAAELEGALTGALDQRVFSTEPLEKV